MEYQREATMKLYFTGQQRVIDTHSRAFAEYIYDTFPLDSHFLLRDVAYPPFTPLASRAVYTRMLLAWMVEQAPDCIERIGNRLYHVKQEVKQP